jgi:hypothetical protein
MSTDRLISILVVLQVAQAVALVVISGEIRELIYEVNRLREKTR